MMFFERQTPRLGRDSSFVQGAIDRLLSFHGYQAPAKPPQRHFQVSDAFA
jgi:hypothetical protein